MTSERQDGNARRVGVPDAAGASTHGDRRPWRRPALTAYGPIGTLTQGGTGGRADGTQSRKK